MSDKTQKELVEQTKALIVRVEDLKKEENILLGRKNTALLELEATERAVHEAKAEASHCIQKAQIASDKCTNVEHELETLNEKKVSLQKDIGSLEEQRKQSQIVIQAETRGFEAKKLELEKTNSDIVKAHESKLKEIEKEIQSSDEELKNAFEILGNLKRTHRDIVGKTEATEKKKVALENSIKEIEEKLKQLYTEHKMKEEAITSADEEIDSLLESRTKLEKELGGISNEIAGRNIDLEEVKRGIVEKTKEFEAQTKRLLGLAEREKLVERRTAILKEKFESAGIPWREI